MSIDVDSVVHVAIRTQDLERSLGFYRDTLGFPEMMRNLYDDGSLLCVYVRASERQFIEIFPDGTGQLPDRMNVGLNHLCFAVPDIDETTRALETLGVALDRAFETPEGRVLFVLDPDGNTIEFKGPEATELETRAADNVRDGGSITVIQTEFSRPASAG
jgi:lactoylglutathione lyase